MKRAIKRKLKLLDIALLRNTKKCIFCGSTSVTKEHVFSRRFHKYLDAPRRNRAKVMVTVVGAKKSEQAFFNMNGPMRDWQIKCVCGGNASTCNNGWMRKLDEKMDLVGARLMRLPSEENLPFRLFEETQKIIAAWAIMKVMVTHNSMVHHMQRKQLMLRQVPPDGWGVWIGHYVRGGNWDPEFSTQPFPLIRDAVLRSRKSHITKANSHATTMVFQHLFIHVVYCRDHSFVKQWRFPTPKSGIIKGHLFRIWPPSGNTILWPGKTLTDREAAIISEVIFRSYQSALEDLGLVPRNMPITEL